MQSSAHLTESEFPAVDSRPTLFLLWMGYVGYYLGRANLALALPVLLSQYNIPYTAAGAIATAGYLCYAIGQPVNGMLIDRFGAKRFFLLGLGISALANLAFGCLSSVFVMVVLWGVNGFFQACGWPALVKIADQWLPTEGRGKPMGVLATSAHVGSVAAWMLGSFLVVNFGWRYVFWVPAVIIAFVFLANALFLHERPEVSDPGDADTGDRRTSGFLVDVMQLLANPHILWTAFILACVNFVYNAISAWLPTYFADGGLALGHVGWRSIAFPLTNMVGTLLVGSLLDTRHEDRQVALLIPIQLGLSVALLGFLWAGPASGVALANLALMGLCIAGANFLVTGPIPLLISAGANQASTVGIINGCGYIGASLGSFLTGLLVEQGGWIAALWLWLAVALLASAAAICFWRGVSKRDRNIHGGVS